MQHRASPLTDRQTTGRSPVQIRLGPFPLKNFGHRRTPVFLADTRFDSSRSLPTSTPGPQGTFEHCRPEAGPALRPAGPLRAEQPRDLAKVTDHLARSRRDELAAIQPDRPEARALGPQEVGLPRIPDVKGVTGFASGSSKGLLEQPRVGLGDADLLRVGHGLEQIGPAEIPQEMREMVDVVR